MKWLVAALVAALLATNSWWLYRAIDTADAQADHEQVCSAHEQALTQALAVIRLAKGRAVRSELIEAAHAALPAFGKPFEKEGWTIAGRLDFKFDGAGAFQDVRVE